MTKNSFRALTVLAVLAVATLADGGVRAQADFDALVRTGDPAPGTPPGVEFRGFNKIVVNEAGEVAFQGLLVGPDVTNINQKGIWGPDASGALSLLAREGDPAPGTPDGVVFDDFRDPLDSITNSIAINAAGEVAFRGFLRGPGVGFNVPGIWGSDAVGLLNLLARKGDAAPGTGAVFGGFREPVINASGEVAFRASLGGPDVTNVNNFGIWGPDTTGALSLLARKGDPAPGTGAVFGESSDFKDFFPFPFLKPVIGRPGEVAFQGFLEGPDVDATNNLGIWVTDATGDLSLLARDGDPAPGTGDAVFSFLLFGEIDINAAGEMVFSGDLTGPDVDFTNNAGIWGRDASGNLSLLVRAGDPAPGTLPGVEFATVDLPVINAAGDMAFLATLIEPGVTFLGSSIWVRDASGTLSLVARQGDQAPGALPGVMFDSFVEFVINAAGEVAFRGSLTGADVTPDNDFGIWGPGASGTPSLLLREGDVIEFSPGNSMPVTFLGLLGLSDDGQTGLQAVASTPFAQAILLSNRNAPPVADAGPDQAVECTSAEGIQVALDGSDSSDPNGDSLTFAWSLTAVPPGSAAALENATSATPNFRADLLGEYKALLTVDDGEAEDQDAVEVTVEDTTRPGVVAALTPVGDGDDEGDDDEGRFRISFAAGDACDPEPSVAAVLDLPDGTDIPAADGQIIEFEIDDEGTEVEFEDGILEIEAPGLKLRVTATDASGNAETVEVEPTGLGGDNDDDTLASAELDD